MKMHCSCYLISKQLKGTDPSVVISYFYQTFIKSGVKEYTVTNDDVLQCYMYKCMDKWLNNIYPNNSKLIPKLCSHANFCAAQ